MNLAGVERVLELEEQLERMRARDRGARASAPRGSQAEMEAELERVRKLVPRRARPDRAHRGPIPARNLKQTLDSGGILAKILV